MNRATAFAALLAGCLTLATGAEAHPRKGLDWRGDGFGDMERMTRRLGLSDEQRERIGAILEAAKAGSAQDRERRRELHEALREQAGNFESGEARALADELGELTKRLAYDRVQAMSRVREVLTEEQLAKLEKARARGQRGFGKGKHGGDRFLFE